MSCVSLHMRGSMCHWDSGPLVAWGATVTLFSKESDCQSWNPFITTMAAVSLIKAHNLFSAQVKYLSGIIFVDRIQPCILFIVLNTAASDFILKLKQFQNQNSSFSPGNACKKQRRCQLICLSVPQCLAFLPLLTFCFSSLSLLLLWARLWLLFLPQEREHCSP